MLKSDLIEKIAKEMNMNTDIAQLVINNVFDAMTDALASVSASADSCICCACVTISSLDGTPASRRQ